MTPRKLSPTAATPLDERSSRRGLEIIIYMLLKRAGGSVTFSEHEVCMASVDMLDVEMVVGPGDDPRSSRVEIRDREKCR